MKNYKKKLKRNNVHMEYLATDMGDSWEATINWPSKKTEDCLSIGYKRFKNVSKSDYPDFDELCHFLGNEFEKMLVGTV